MEPGVKWITVGGVLKQVYCYFDDEAASPRRGWAVVAKIAAVDRPYCGCNNHGGSTSCFSWDDGPYTRWEWGSSEYTSDSTFGNATVAPHLEPTDAKSELYGTLGGVQMRLATMGDATLDGPTWEFTGTAKELFEAGANTYTLVEGNGTRWVRAGDDTSKVADHSLQGQPYNTWIRYTVNVVGGNSEGRSPASRDGVPFADVGEIKTFVDGTLSPGSVRGSATLGWTHADYGHWSVHNNWASTIAAFIGIGGRVTWNTMGGTTCNNHGAPTMGKPSSSSYGWALLVSDS